MKLWRVVLSCCVLLALGVAVVFKSLEVKGLREQARPLAVPVSSRSFEVVKPVALPGGETAGETPELDESRPAQMTQSDLLFATPTFLSGGALSPDAVKLLKLTDEEARRLAESLRRFRGEAMQDLASRLKFTGNRYDDGSIHHHYHARARRDRGQAYFDSLALEFRPILGRDRTRELMKAMRRDDLAVETGRVDVELELIRSEKGIVKVNYQFRSPRSGGISMFGGSSLAEFETKFGKLFEEEGE